MKSILGFGCDVGVWACANCIGALALSAEAAASVVPPSRMLRRLGVRSVALSRCIVSRPFCALMTCSSMLPYRFQLARYGFRAGLDGGVLRTVARRLFVGLATRKVGILPHACLIGGNERSDLLAQPGVLPDDVPALLRIGGEVEGPWERPIFNYAVDAVETVQVNLVIPPFDGHELLTEEQQHMLAVGFLLLP